MSYGDYERWHRRFTHFTWVDNHDHDKGGVLTEPKTEDTNTPEGFYHFEQVVRSDFRQHFLAHSQYVKWFGNHH